MGSLIFESRDASGLYYRRNRYYDSEKGRFTQEDPIGLEGGVNVYGFGRGDPVTYSDAFGLLADSVWIGIRPLAIPVVGVWYVHSSVRVDNEMFELLQNENGNSKVIRTTVAGNSDLEKYTWYPVSTPEGQTDAQFSDRVRRNAISLGGRINTDHPDYEALGKNCHWYTRSVITASGAQVPGRAWTERGIAPGLCRNGACTPVETRPLIQH
jgi:RHS repeat-associated protein